MVAIPVDPYVVHCQWEIAHADLEEAKRALGVDEHEYWPILQFYDVTSGDQAGRHASFSVEVQLGAGNWYVRSCSPERTYRANLALKGEDGSLAVIASADRVETPPSAPSSCADEHWLPIRLSPQLPESTASVQPHSGVHSELAGFPVRLPIDMHQEVSSRLRALYGDPDQGVLEPQLQGPVPADRSEEAGGRMASLRSNREPETLGLVGQPSLPVDMRAEVSQLLSRLYQGLEQKLSEPAGGLFTTEAFRMRRVGSRTDAHTENATADLAEWNERSFISGTSSR